MGQPRWEVRLGSEFVDFDLKSQQQLERAMQAGQFQLKLLLAGQSFTVAWSRAADDCWDIAMRSDARPERVRPVRRHVAAPPVPPSAAMDTEADEAEHADQRGDGARRRDGSGRSSLGAARERGGGAGAERGGGTGRGGPSGSGSGSGTSGAAAEAAEADEPAPLRRRSLSPEPEEEEQLGKDKVRWLLLRAPP